jgi:anti-sigma factor RsiW
MDHSYIAEHNIAARYVLGALSPAESAQFEEHFVDCPQCQAEIEDTRNFREGLKALTSRAPGVLPPYPR